MLLLVEDDASIRLTCAEFLKTENFEVEEAADGAIALDMIRANPSRYGMVLSDQMMPVMTGLELLTALRREGITTPFVFMTASTIEPATALMVADDLIRKPLDVERLLNVVTKHYRGKESALPESLTSAAPCSLPSS